jgi:hypothetical protein
VAAKHFETRAELERQMDVARRLCAEILAGAGWIFSARAGAVTVIRRRLFRITAAGPRQA